MKTTLIIHDSVMAKVKHEAAKRGCTMSEIVESALRLMFSRKPKEPDLPPLPTYDSGGFVVDIADREALYDAMERADRVEP